MFLKKRVVMMFRRDPLFGGILVLVVAILLGGTLWAIAQAKVLDDPPKPTPVVEATPVSPPSEAAKPESQEPELVTERYPNGALKIERQVSVDDQFNYVNHGIYKEYDRDGNLIRTGQYRMGTQEGRWIQYFKAGEGSLFSGELSSQFPGPFVSKADFVDGKLHGTWNITSKAGHKVIEWQIDRGVRHGRACWYHPNGKPRQEGRYNHGVPVGLFHEWDPSGTLIRSVTYLDGRPLTRKIHWHNRNQKAYEGTVLPGRDVPKLVFDWWNTSVTSDLATTTLPEQKHGRWTAWYPNGQTKVEGQYCRGVPVGKFAWWYENGQKQADGQYVNGLRTGIWVTWHQNGLKESFGEYAGGVIVGKSRRWDPNGKLVKRHNLPGESGENTGLSRQDHVKRSGDFDRIEQLTHTAWPFRQFRERHPNTKVTTCPVRRNLHDPATQTAASCKCSDHSGGVCEIRPTKSGRYPLAPPTTIRQASRQSSVTITGVRAIK